MVRFDKLRLRTHRMTLTIAGHTYIVHAYPKHTKRVPGKGVYKYTVWRDKPWTAYPSGELYSKRNLYAAFPRLRGHLAGWPPER